MANDEVKPPRIQLISNKFYDYMKFVALILLPSIGSFYYGGAELFHWPNPMGFNGMINLIVLFLGSVMGISTKSYNSSDTKYDGQVVLAPASEEETDVKFSLQEASLQDKSKKTLVLKILR